MEDDVTGHYPDRHARNNGDHEVHREVCPVFPNAGMRLNGWHMTWSGNPWTNRLQMPSAESGASGSTGRQFHITAGSRTKRSVQTGSRFVEDPPGGSPQRQASTRHVGGERQ